MRIGTALAEFIGDRLETASPKTGQSEQIMIHIEESFIEPDTVAITIEGKLDRISLPILREVCQRHLDASRRKSIVLEIKSLSGISLEGKQYLKGIQNRVCLRNLPEFLKMELLQGS